MSSFFERPQPDKPLHAQLAELEQVYTTKRTDLERRIAEENEEARRLAENDIYLERDAVAQAAVRTGKTGTGENVPDLKAFLLERRQILKDNPNLDSRGPRRAVDLPRDVRADDPDIWKRGTGNK
jgi:hypothetical protein